MSRSRVIAVLLAVVLAGCAAPVATTAPDPAPPDPTTDVQGWEKGYWHNESVDIDTSDGMNDSERAAVVGRAMARVETVRGVEFDRDVPVSVVTREEYREQVTGGSGDGSDGPSGGALFTQTKYEALFLVGQTDDAAERERQNDAQAVQGYYDISNDEIVIVADGETPVIDEVTLAQELFHAYQFRHLVPGRLPRNYTEDTITAWRAVIEGDANLVDRLYERRCESGWDCLRERPSGGGNGGNDTDAADDGPGIHMGIYLLQYFPYAEGEAYVRSVKEEGGWEAVDDLYGDMPLSSESVIDGGADDPRYVEVTDRSGSDWERIQRSGRRNSEAVGQYGIATMFAYTLYDGRNESLVDRDQFLNLEDGEVKDGDPLNYGIEPASGWDGDRLYAYRDDRNRRGFVWRIAWDRPGDADQFREAYLELLSYHGASRVEDGVYRIDDGPFAGAYAIRQRGSTVTIVGGPDLDSLGEIHEPTATSLRMEMPTSRSPNRDPGTTAAVYRPGPRPVSFVPAGGL